MGSCNRSYSLTIHNVQIQEIHASPLNARMKVRHRPVLFGAETWLGSDAKIELRQDVRVQQSTQSP